MIRLGYVAIDTQLPSPNSGFRLAGYSEERMLETTRQNLSALLGVLERNAEHDVQVFRIGSKLVPFASHPANSGVWREALAEEFARVGAFVREHGMRLSMHPGQHTVLNTPSEQVLEATLTELDYHASALGLLGYGCEGPIKPPAILDDQSAEELGEGRRSEHEQLAPSMLPVLPCAVHRDHRTAS